MLAGIDQTTDTNMITCLEAVSFPTLTTRQIISWPGTIG
jgi:hypothetical protein